MASKFSAFPNWWVRQLGLKTFAGGGQAGVSIAALKVQMALSLLMHFQTRKAKASLTDLETLTGLSRPMVLKGIARLEELQLLTVNRDPYINEYELRVTPTDDRWCKLPYELLRKRLPELSNRGHIPLAALKIYLTLATMRPNDSAKIALGHDKLRDYTGIQKGHVRAALDILYSHNLLHVESVEDQKTKTRFNVYQLLGL